MNTASQTYTRTYLKERAELIKYLSQSDWHLSATLTFKSPQHEDAAQKILGHFWNRVDGSLFGKSAKRFARGCNRVCFMERGISGQHVHYHAAIAVPSDRGLTQDRFQMFLQAHWRSIAEAGLAEFKPIYDQEGWLSYITKGVGRMSLDAFDVSNSHIAG
jgi:hypothetical protein